MPGIPYFADSYPQARSAFLHSARNAGARLASYHNEHCGDPAIARLDADVSWIGPRHPESMLVTVSGTHGIEGFCGSACQTGLFSELSSLAVPAGTAIVAVHALNPYGFAYERRVNEDNVDINRNFVDHADPPHNAAYDELHDALVPAGWDGRSREAADTRLDAVAKARGLRYLQRAITHGQYRHPDGLFYGGDRPVWSHRTLATIAEEHLTGCRRIAYIDLHTGLGSRGHGEPIFRGGRDSGALTRARAWYGRELTVSEDGSSSSTPIIGNTASLIADRLDPGQELTAITLEFGTLPGREVLDALRADNWLHLQRSPDPAIVAEIKRHMRAAFYPPNCEWRAGVWRRARDVFQQALAGIAQ